MHVVCPAVEAEGPAAYVARPVAEAEDVPDLETRKPSAEELEVVAQLGAQPSEESLVRAGAQLEQAAIEERERF